MTFTNSFVRISSVILSIVLLAVACGETHYHQGEALYRANCASCHMEDGSGLAQLYPPLAQADYIREDPVATACIIRYGLQDTIVVNGVTYRQPMNGIRELSDFQITNIINYINQAWGNDYGEVTLAQVRERLEECAPTR